MIQKTDHCRLCDHQKRDFNVDAYCGLTKKVPSFNNYCNKINLDKTFLKEVESINILHYKINNRKFDVIGGIVLFPLIGILVLLADYWFYKTYYEPYFIASSAMFGIMATVFVVGIVLIAKGTGPWFNHKKEKEIIHQKKEKLDAICKLYGITYEIEYYKKKNPFDLEVHAKHIQIKKTAIIR